MSEHWAVYQYFSTASRRPEVAVIELYDAAPHGFKPRELLFGTVAKSTSSFEPVPLEVGDCLWHRSLATNKFFDACEEFSHS